MSPSFIDTDVQMPQSPSIETLTKPLAAYAHTRILGDIVFLAGQGCRDPETDTWAGVTFDENGKAVHINFEEQVRGVLRNVERALTSVHLSKHHLIDVQVFLTDMKEQFPILNRVWNEFFYGLQTLPVRTTVAVKELPGLNLVEMKAIASIVSPS